MPKERKTGTRKISELAETSGKSAGKAVVAIRTHQRDKQQLRRAIKDLEKPVRSRKRGKTA